MTNDVLVSVVLTVYNGGKYLDAAIRSILEQTYTHFELIIVNDGSTDGSGDLIRSFAEKDARIRVIERENRGLVYSLNEGIAAAKGRYIARMDADDISLPQRFEKQVQYLEEKGLDIVGGHYIMIDENDKIVDATIIPVIDDAITVCLSICPPFAHGSVMFRKEFWQRHDMHYGKRFSIAEDYSLWQDFYSHGAKLGNIDEFIFKYRVHADSFSASKLKRMNQEVKQLRKIFVKKYSEELIAAVNRLSAVKSRSFFEEEVRQECAYLLGKYTGNPVFLKMLKTAGRKNLSLTMTKIFTRKL